MFQRHTESRSRVFCLGIIVFLCNASVRAQEREASGFETTRVRLLPAGVDPTTTPVLDYDAIMQRGETLAVDVWLEWALQGLNGAQLVFDCDAGGGPFPAAVGIVSLGADTSRPDYFLADGIPADVVTNVCGDEDGWGGLILNNAPSSGVLPANPSYLATIEIQASMLGDGQFTICLRCPPSQNCPPPTSPHSHLFLPGGATIFFLDYCLNVTVIPPRGACCNAGIFEATCTDNLDFGSCILAGGTWLGPGSSCPSIACTGSIVRDTYLIEGLAEGIEYSWSLEAPGLDLVEFDASAVPDGFDEIDLASAMASNINEAAGSTIATVDMLNPGLMSIAHTGPLTFSVGQAGQLPNCVVSPQSTLR